MRSAPTLTSAAARPWPRARYRGLTRNTISSHHLTHVNAENKKISKSMWDTKVVLPSFFGLMTNPKLLDVAEQFCGPELIASERLSAAAESAEPRVEPGAMASGLGLL